MECSICMQAIASTNNTSTTECGHTFHFQCLYHWNRRHSNCPLCRKDFGTFEDESHDPFFVLTGTGRLGRTFIFDEIQRVLTDEVTTRRRALQAEADAMYRAIPIEDFTRTEIENCDIDLIVRHVEGISRESAKAYLRHFQGDIVETIMFLTYWLRSPMPIPDFRERQRPALPEPYVSPDVSERVVKSRRQKADRGYESS